MTSSHPFRRALCPLIALLAVGASLLPGRATTMTFAIRDTGHAGGEPTLGVLPDGTIALQAFESAIVSHDEGLTWTVGTAVNGGLTLDPYLHVDAATGRILSAADMVACVPMAVSDDSGSTWQEYARNSCPPLDHPQFGSGPWRDPAGKAYPRSFYYCSNDSAVAACTFSEDGGATWGAPVPAFLTLDPSAPTGTNNVKGFCNGVTGKPQSAPDGTLYLPKKHCGRPFVGVSHDDGATWETHWVAPGSRTPTGIGDDPYAATTDDGTLYVSWTGEDPELGSPHAIARSTDQGKTWSAPMIASPPDVLSTTFPLTVAGRNGAVATAYLGTRDTYAGTDRAPPSTRWHLFVSYSFDADSPSPTWTTVQVTPDDDPVHMGCIARQGGACTDNTTLLDFNGIAMTPDGRVAIAYTDSCDRCADAAHSVGRRAFLAIQTDGPTLK